MGIGKFQPLQNHYPWTDRKKIRHSWLRLRWDPLCQIWYKSTHWWLLGKWVKYNKNYYFLKNQYDVIFPLYFRNGWSDIDDIWQVDAKYGNVIEIETGSRNPIWWTFLFPKRKTVFELSYVNDIWFDDRIQVSKEVTSTVGEPEVHCVPKKNTWPRFWW